MCKHETMLILVFDPTLYTPDVRKCHSVIQVRSSGENRKPEVLAFRCNKEYVQKEGALFSSCPGCHYTVLPPRVRRPSSAGPEM